MIEGKPIRVGERELRPLVRVETRVRRQAFVGGKGLAVDTVTCVCFGQGAACADHF